jgi:hypothetical protein
MQCRLEVLSVVKTNATLPTGRAECVQRSSVASTHHEGQRFVCLSRTWSRGYLEGIAGSGAVGAAGERG